MSRVLSFVRLNKNNEEYGQIQIGAINKYIEEKNINVDKSFEIEINIPSQESNLMQLLENCDQNSTLVIYDLNVLGRTTETIIEIIKFLLSSNVRLIVINQNLDLVDDKDMLTKMIIGMMSMTLYLEKDLMSLRTKEALTEKKLNGISLGKPKGTIQKSKFDKQRDKIEELLALGLSVRKIAKLLGYNNHIGLNNYVKKRKIRETLPNILDIAS